MSTSVDFSPVMRQIDRLAQNLGRDIDGLAQNLGREIDGVSYQIGQVSRDLDTTSANLLELKHSFEAYVEVQQRANAVQRASTEIVGLKAQLDREFGTHQTVRDSTIGTLQALDVGIVTKQTVQRVSEELMISTPRYWLAPAIVALAAWIRDDEDLAAKAVAESCRRNQTKCSLLFTLALARQGRLEASSHWLKHYFVSLDPHNLPRDFAVIMEGASRDAFGAQGRVLVEHKLSEWLTLLREDDSRLQEQIAIWRKEITNQRTVVNQREFPTLSRLSPTWPTLTAQLENASALVNTHDKYLDIRETTVELTRTLRDQMDDLLERLVTEYDDDELPLRRSIVRTQAVIDNDGDTTRAQQEADALQAALEERIDALTMQSYTAIAPDLLGVSVTAQQISVGAAKNEFRRAVTEYAADYRTLAVSEADITLGYNHSNYASQYRFVGCNVSTGLPQGTAERCIVDAWQSSTQRYIEAVAFRPVQLVLPATIAAVATVIGLAVALMAGIIILLLGGGGVALYGVMQKSAADREVASIRANTQAATEHSLSLYRIALAEFVDFTLAYEEADRGEEPLLELIDSWHSTVARDEN